MEQASKSGPEEGKWAPDFSLLNLEGKSISLSDFRGKKDVIVYFYPKDFTPGCSTEASQFARDYYIFKEANIEIIGVSPDNSQSHQKFREKMKIPYLLASDVKNEISKKYGVYGPKSFMGRDYFGVNRTTFLINKEGKIFKIFGKVKPNGHSKEVFEAFNELKKTSMSMNS